MNNILTFFLVAFMSVPSFGQDVVEQAIKDGIKANASSGKKSNSLDEAKEAVKKIKEQQKNPQAKKEDKKEEKKVEPKKPEGPKVISKKEADLLESLKKKEKKKTEEKKEATAKKRNPIYIPAPVKSAKEKSQGNWVVERDSSRILTQRIHTDDALTIKMCFSAGLTVSLHNDVPGEFQRIILDDKIYFDAADLENKRGAYVRLKKPVPEGKYWESALRLVAKKNDQTYLVNLVGVPCPNGLVPFPKVVYLKPKHGLLSANSAVLTPEDTIIAVSKGLPRVQKNRIRLYDMVASSNSDWIVFGLEVQYLNNTSGKTSPKVKLLDNLQVSELRSKLQYLPLQSKKATAMRKVSTVRFRLAVNIGKDYILNSRYMHLVFLDEAAGHYQYVRVDILPYFLSLKKRGFQL